MHEAVVSKSPGSKASEMPGSRCGLMGQCIGEFIGTLILVFFGVGSIHVAVVSGAHMGSWEVAMVWGIGIALAIYTVGAVSGAHLNPAITFAMAIWRQFPAKKILPYIIFQLAGAMAGSLILYGLFHGMIEHFEVTRGIMRGMPGSELSGMMFGEYFPNPGIIGVTQEAYAQVSHATAMLAEGIGTAILLMFIFALTEVRNPNTPRYLTPLFVGLTVSIIISIIAPLTQAGLNPARDFGPRLVSYFFGWGKIAIPGARGNFDFLTVYILSPIIGGLFGAGVYQGLIRRYLGFEGAGAEQ
jgi:glycerol uptake facilitator protein